MGVPYPPRRSRSLSTTLEPAGGRRTAIKEFCFTYEGFSSLDPCNCRTYVRACRINGKCHAWSLVVLPTVSGLVPPLVEPSLSKNVQSLLDKFDSATATGNVEALVGSLASNLAKARPLAHHPNGQAAGCTLAQLDRRVVQAPAGRRCR